MHPGRIHEFIVGVADVEIGIVDEGKISKKTEKLSTTDRKVGVVGATPRHLLKLPLHTSYNVFHLVKNFGFLSSSLLSWKVG